MEVYRIAKMEYLSDLSGEGSRLNGGRWNSIGTPALYTASYRSLCMLETLVYTPFKMLKGYGVVTLQIPEAAPLLFLEPKDLPFDWDVFPSRRSAALLGSRLLVEMDYLAFRVPSSLLKEEWNWVLNPRHPLMREVSISAGRPLVFNERFKNVME